jgi:cystathionine beta-lyase/cystathionine gamma-synthase
MANDRWSLDTHAVHAGEPKPRMGGAINAPIFQSSTFEYEDNAPYHDIKYARLSNTPSHDFVHEKLAALEGAEAGLVAASGMAAITATLLTVLKSGDHFLAQRCLYGGTLALVAHDLIDLGITVDFIDATDAGSWEKKLRPNTKLIYAEAMTNPLLEVADHGGIVAFARQHKIVAVIDNTFATPVNFQPLKIGYDLVIHSATKYLNGHSDIIAGAVLGSRHWITKITHKLNHLGGCLDMHACFLLQRGIKTLTLRMARHNENAQAVAEFLATHPGVGEVYYPGLMTSPQHSRARKYFSSYGGVVSFRVKGGLEKAKQLANTVKIPAHAASLGGVESLILVPAISTHQQMTASERGAIGIHDDLVRFAIGIEHQADLIDDLRTALAGIR